MNEIRVTGSKGQIPPTARQRRSAGGLETPREPRQSRNPDRQEKPRSTLRRRRRMASVSGAGRLICPSLTQSGAYCGRCFASWNSCYKKEDYEEKHCHTCGSENATRCSSLCALACFRKYEGCLASLAAKLKLMSDYLLVGHAACKALSCIAPSLRKQLSRPR